jgi:hypothetical protein
MGSSKIEGEEKHKKHNQNLLFKHQHSDKDKEICCYQQSSPIAASRCPVTQTLPSTSVVVVLAVVRVVVVAVAVAWWWR